MQRITPTRNRLELIAFGLLILVIWVLVPVHS